jgi:hypothetical protein
MLLSCNHTVLKPLKCSVCKAFQDEWYQALAQTGFKDIEYGHDNARQIYQPVPLVQADQSKAEYYSAVWLVHHEWAAAGCRPHDLVVSELLAAQQGSTGTVLGIVKVLKARGIKPYEHGSVQRTIALINKIIENRYAHTYVGNKRA